MIFIFIKVRPVKQKTRTVILHFLDQFGKFSFVDMYVTVFMVVSFYVTIKLQVKFFLFTL